MSTDAAPKPPRVFISYTHDSPHHEDRVLALSNRLREKGIDSVLDQYEESPPEGWTLWMIRQIKDSDFTLMVCTETYYRRVMKDEKPGVGQGALWEGHLIRTYFYEDGALNTRFVPLLFDSSDKPHIPDPFRDSTYYLLERDSDKLHGRLTGQPLTPRPDLGTLRTLPPRDRKQSFSSPSSKPPKPWNVPHPRNPWFTGRGKLLEDLRRALTTEGASAISQTQAIAGLGGVGKTQTAVEYAYRHRDSYQAVFWAQADTEVALSSGFLDIARQLNLPEKDAQDLAQAREAVKRWLQSNDGWLLVFDNADAPELVEPFLPPDRRGHVLLTSRASVFDALGISHPLELEKMKPGEATEFLFKRTGRSGDDLNEKKAAEDLAKELDYLPLALEQAAACIKANKSRFQDYLASYRTQGLKLFKKYPPVAGKYPKSVITTWALNFAEVEKTPAAADLLRVSAFLAPDDIPLELITKGASELGPAVFDAL